MTTQQIYTEIAQSQIWGSAYAWRYALPIITELKRRVKYYAWRSKNMPTPKTISLNTQDEWAEEKERIEHDRYTSHFEN